jgi:hypothetical protein
VRPVRLGELIKIIHHIGSQNGEMSVRHSDRNNAPSFLDGFRHNPAKNASTYVV